MPMEQNVSGAAHIPDTDTTYEEKIRAVLARRTGTDTAHWRLALRARHAMQVIFGVLKEECAAEHIATQAFTCLTAVNPILDAGLHPYYADISEDTLSVNGHTLSIPPHTAAVVLQHTFGIIDSFAAQQAADAAHRQGALLIEDSAHCAGRMAKREDGTPIADISVHSFGAEKVLPTKFGAAVWINPKISAPQNNTGDRHGRYPGHLILRALEKLPRPSVLRGNAIRTYTLQNKVLGRLPGRLSPLLREMLCAAHIFYPPVAPGECGGRGNGKCLAPNARVNAAVYRGLKRLGQYENELTKCTAIYNDALKTLPPSLCTIPKAVCGRDPLLRFPLLTGKTGTGKNIDPEEMFHALREKGFYPGRWYRPLLFPGAKDARIYDLPAQSSRLPVTLAAARRIINLRTQETPAHAARLAAAAREWLEKQ